MLKALLGVLFLLILLFVLQGLRINHEIAGRPERALTDHYAGRQISITDTVDLHTMQKCFVFELSDRRGASVIRKIAMVSGDADQRWKFSAEYKSMAECQAHPNHG